MFRFSVGDFVNLKYSATHAIQVLETLAQTCPGGTQLHYKGRLYEKGRLLSMRARKEPHWYLVSGKIEAYLEQELAEVVIELKGDLLDESVVQKRKDDPLVEDF